MIFCIEGFATPPQTEPEPEPEPEPESKPEPPRSGLVSWVWSHMTKNSDGTAKCNICSEIVKRSGGSTNRMSAHLNRHKIYKDGSTGHKDRPRAPKARPKGQ